MKYSKNLVLFPKATLIVFSCIFLTACTDVLQNLQNARQNQEEQVMKQYGFFHSSSQTVVFSFPTAKPWNKINKLFSNSGYSISYAPEGENSYNWKEIIERRMISYNSSQNISAQKYLQLATNNVKKYCQKVTPQFIAQTANSITYSLNVMSCKEEGGNQLQILKVFNGIDGVYSIRYSAMLGKVSTSEIRLATRAIESAQLTRNINQ